MKDHLVNKFSSNHHPRKRNGDKINDFLCSRCFSQKCYAYEIAISDIQNEYAYFKAYVEHKRGNKEVSYILQKEDHYGVYSDYARNAINGGAPATIEHEDWDAITELQKYLISNNFKFKCLDTKELLIVVRFSKYRIISLYLPLM